MKELHSLIQNMTKEEKREFKIYLNTNESSKSSYYVKLFDFLEKNQKIDNKVLKAKAESFEFGKQFNITKQKLWEHLLDSLIISRRQTNFNKRLHHDIARIELLLENNCYKAANRKFNKVYKEAADNEQIYATLRLSLAYTGLAQYAFNRNEPYELNYMGSYAFDNLEKIRYCFHFNYATELLKQTILRQDTGVDITERVKQVEKIRKEYLDINIPEEHNTIYAEYCKYTASSILYNFNKNGTELEKISKKVISSIDKKPALKKGNLLAYVNCIIGLLSALLEQKKWEEFDTYIDMADKLVYNNKLIREAFLPAFMKLKYYKAYYTNDKDTREKLVNDLTTMVTSKEKPMPMHTIVDLLLIIIRYHVEMKDYKKALIYINWFRNDIPKENIEIQSVNFFYFLLCHLELNNYDVVYSQIDNYKKEMPKEDMIGKETYTLAKKLVEASNHEQEKKLKTAWYKEIKQVPDALLTRYFEGFPIEEWVYA